MSEKSPEAFITMRDHASKQRALMHELNEAGCLDVVSAMS